MTEEIEIHVNSNCKGSKRTEMHCQVKLLVLSLLINSKICYLSISISVKLIS